MNCDLTPSKMICQLYQHIRLNGYDMGSFFDDPTWNLDNAFASIESDGGKRIEWPGIGLDVSDLGGRVTYHEGCQKRLSEAYDWLCSTAKGGEA